MHNQPSESPCVPESGPMKPSMPSRSTLSRFFRGFPRRLSVAAMILCLGTNLWAADGVKSFVSANWNQGCFYNANLPAVTSGGACGRAWTGCLATAMGQILKHYQYPSAHANGSKYDFAKMPDRVTSANPDVAKLMRDLGVSVGMNWGGHGIGLVLQPCRPQEGLSILSQTAVHRRVPVQDPTGIDRGPEGGAQCAPSCAGQWWIALLPARWLRFAGSLPLQFRLGRPS